MIEVNEELTDHPELVNNDPYGKGWIFKVRIADKNELNSLMSSEEYTKLTKEG